MQKQPQYDLRYPVSAIQSLGVQIGYPHIYKIDNLKITPSFPPDDFCISHTFNPNFICEVVSKGFFPMSIKIGNDHVPALKMHHERCILDLDTLKVPRSTRKLGGKFEFSTNKAFDQIVKKINDKHGQDWLCLPLRTAFKEIFLNPDKYSIQIYSIEVWQGDTLVAGELGYTVGKVYTSLTGYYDVTGTGSVQLHALGQLLKSRGIMFWDFGMFMKYKGDMGAISVDRMDWLKIVSKYGSGGKCSLLLDRVNARQVMDYGKEVVVEMKDAGGTKSKKQIKAEERKAAAKARKLKEKEEKEKGLNKISEDSKSKQTENQNSEEIKQIEEPNK